MGSLFWPSSQLRPRNLMICCLLAGSTADSLRVAMSVCITWPAAAPPVLSEEEDLSLCWSVVWILFYLPPSQHMLHQCMVFPSNTLVIGSLSLGAAHLPGFLGPSGLPLLSFTSRSLIVLVLGLVGGTMGLDHIFHFTAKALPAWKGLGFVVVAIACPIVLTISNQLLVQDSHLGGKEIKLLHQRSREFMGVGLSIFGWTPCPLEIEAVLSNIIQQLLPCKGSTQIQSSNGSSIFAFHFR